MESNKAELETIFNQIKRKAKLENAGSSVNNNNNDNSNSNGKSIHFGFEDKTMGVHNYTKTLLANVGAYYPGVGKVSDEDKNLFPKDRPLRQDGIVQKWDDPYDENFDSRWQEEEQKRLDALMKLPEYKFAQLLSYKTQVPIEKIVDEQTMYTTQDKIFFEREQKKKAIERLNVTIGDLESGLKLLETESRNIKSTNAELKRKIDTLYRAMSSYETSYNEWIRAEVSCVIHDSKSSSVDEFKDEVIKAISPLATHLTNDPEESIPDLVVSEFYEYQVLPEGYPKLWKYIFDDRGNFLCFKDLKELRVDYYNKFITYLNYLIDLGYISPVEYIFGKEVVDVYIHTKAIVTLDKLSLELADRTISTTINGLYQAKKPLDNTWKYELSSLFEKYGWKYSDDFSAYLFTFEGNMIAWHYAEERRENESLAETIDNSRKEVLRVYENRLQQKIELVSVPEGKYYMTKQWADNPINTGKISFSSQVVGAMNAVKTKIEAYCPNLKSLKEVGDFLADDTLRVLFSEAVAVELHKSSQLFPKTYHRKEQKKWGNIAMWDVYQRLKGIDSKKLKPK